MPAAKGGRSTPARKKAKLDDAATPSASQADAGPSIESAEGIVKDDATAAADLAPDSPTSSRNVGKSRTSRRPDAHVSFVSNTQDAAGPSEPRNTPAVVFEAEQASTPRIASGRPPRSAKSKAKARIVVDDDQEAEAGLGEDSDFDAPASPAASISTPPPAAAADPSFTPLKSTPRPPRSAKGKAKAKFKDEDDDEEDTWSRKDPDLEVYSQEGPLSALRRVQLKTDKPRSQRPLWVQGIYRPPFFGVPPKNSLATVQIKDQDGDTQPERSTSQALPWPADGLAKTWLDPAAYPAIQKSLHKFWMGQVGWIPNEGVLDWSWFPGKAFGYAKNQERSAWAQKARLRLREGADSTDEATMPGERVGWPFIQPWLDTQLHNMQILSNTDAQPFLRDTTTQQRSTLKHPTTVMKLAVPELTMRSRLKRSIITDTPKKQSKRAGGTAEDEVGAEEEDAADADESAIAALDANQEPVNLDDPKFANVPNLGFEEKEPVYGDVLQISVGPPGREVPVKIPKGTSRRLDSLGIVPDEGHLLNVGGHVYALDWAPVPVHLNTGKEYFVVSAANSKAPMTYIGHKQQCPAPANLQIWSVSPDLTASNVPSPSKGKQREDGASSSKGKGEARLQMVICHEAGSAFKLAWCPIGHDYDDGSGDAERPRRLGLLAGCFADGSLSVFSVPHPELVLQNRGSASDPFYIHLKPILKLSHPLQSATSLSWAGGELLAFGGSLGWIGVWNVGQLLRSPTPPSSPPLPDYCIRAHQSAITDLSFILLPPIDSDGRFRTTSPPTNLFSVSLDGHHSLTDLTRCSTTSIERSRTIFYACAFSPFTGGNLVHEHADGSVSHYSLRPEEMLRSRNISHAPSRVLSLSSSPFHPMIAMGTAHGEVKVANLFRTLRRSQRNHLPVYQTILNRSTGELVMRHHLQPEIANIAENKGWHIGTWHPLLAVTAVKWNPNIGRCRLLLSGTAAGVVKVDFMRPPFEDM